MALSKTHTNESSYEDEVPNGSNPSEHLPPCSAECGRTMTLQHETVNHPSHYTTHPSGIECIQITEHHNFCVGNAMKYMWRAGLKGDTQAQQLEDLKKARWYIDREISRLERAGRAQEPTGAPGAGPVRY